MNERLIDLESKFAHQEFTIDALKNALFEQDKVIAALEKTVKRLTEQFDSLSPEAKNAPVNEKPPHY